MYHKKAAALCILLTCTLLTSVCEALHHNTKQINPYISQREFVLSENLTKGQAQVHASTLEATDDGSVVCAAFYGSKEGHNDVNIILSRRSETGWSPPQVMTETGKAHWNPVLFEVKPDDLVLMYKVGKSPKHWVTMFRESLDQGRTWSPERPLVSGDKRQGRGPVKNKPIRLDSGRILAPASLEREEWKAFVDITDDEGHTWSSSNQIHAADLPVGGKFSRGVIQPSLWQDGRGDVHMLLRSTEGYIYKSDSTDDGKTWCTAYPLAIYNNNSGLDVVRTSNGFLYLVCNPVVNAAFGSSRSPLTLFFSRDKGNTWTKMLDLETGKGEYSYPAIIEQNDNVYISYTWQRRNIAFWHFTQAQLAKLRMNSNKTL